MLVVGVGGDFNVPFGGWATENVLFDPNVNPTTIGGDSAIAISVEQSRQIAYIPRHVINTILDYPFLLQQNLSADAEVRYNWMRPYRTNRPRILSLSGLMPLSNFIELISCMGSTAMVLRTLRAVA